MLFEQVKTFLAIYGAITSTVLLIREILKERRKITIILEYVAWYERVQIVIVNSGHRPITITEISMRIFSSNGEDDFGEPIPKNALFDLDLLDKPLPQIIKDGESVSLPLSSVISKNLLDNKLKAKINIFDAEGNKFSDFKIRTLDQKWGGYHQQS